MSRILLTWELGMNLGHLTRLLPIATRLKARGHSVLVAARDLASAAAVLGPAGISFVQAPHLPQGIPLPHRPTGYADILLSQGWSDRSALWGLVHGWLNLYRMFRPDVVVHDYSPTARLASRIAGIPSVLVGNGFELPPATNPLPPFPGFSWATPEKAAESERIAVANANAVASAFGTEGIEALCQLLQGQAVLFATFPELDHYGSRADARYVGPLLGKLNVERVDWPEGSGNRIFACLRPDTQNVEAILGGLLASEASVVCFARGFSRDKLDRYRHPRIRFVSRPVDLKHLASDAQLCVSYGAEGTMATFLLAGVPQLISPWQVEAHMAARRIEAMGAGLVLRGSQTAESVAKVINSALNESVFRTSAGAFRSRHPGFELGPTEEVVVSSIESAGSIRAGFGSDQNRTAPERPQASVSQGVNR